MAISNFSLKQNYPLPCFPATTELAPAWCLWKTISIKATGYDPTEARLHLCHKLLFWTEPYPAPAPD
jgi:hypothetical protein